MDKIASFQMDHEKLLPGLYVSRKDTWNGVTITTFDMRMKAPNREPVMDMPVMHTLEHLAATYMRNDPKFGPKMVYFGPMGCRTGCYFLMEGDLNPSDVLDLVIKTLDWILAFEGEIPGAKPKECGNYLEHNLNTTKYEAKKYVELLRHATEANFSYPK
ncbi:MAG: S-ribosylhomocysteine lyase [Spirochaetaceae bacterium]|jgi:S-ribosylhomocysteine lyase|nr:S-ribosylhomocysteine lyase [Spirochaetaceae bacterium]